MTRVRRISRVLLYGLASVLVLLLAAAAAERVLWRGKVLPGVRLVGASVSGKGATGLGDSVAEASARLETTPVEVRIDTERVTFDPRRINLQVDREATVAAVQDAGRDGGVFGQIFGTFTRLIASEDVTWSISYDDQALDDVIHEWANTVAVDPQDGSLEFEGATVTPVQPKAGRELDRSGAKRVLIRSLREGTASDGLRLPARVDRPEVSSREVADAAAKARALLQAPVTVNLDTLAVVLSPDQMGAVMSTEEKHGKLELRLDHDRLKAALGPDAAALEGSPKDASFSVEGNRVIVVAQVVGRVIDLDDLEKKILQGGTAVGGTFKEELPETTTEELEALHVTEYISGFTTNYPAGQPRVLNIQKAAGIVDGTIVRPGETFSLNGILERRTCDKGWVPAPVIYDGEFTEDCGGGVSQFATTTYNAAFFGGFPLLEHQAHSVYISRYPMGREATVSWPSPDLKWRNDTDNAVLIRSSAGSTSVTVNFYSTKTRSVAAEGPEVVERTPPPEEVVVNAAIARGTSHVLEKGSDATVVKVTRVLRDLDGNELGRKTYTTRYKAQARKVEYHPCDHPDPAKRPPPEDPQCAAPPTPETTTTTVPAGPP